jgi:hypothetical protein
VTVIRRPGQTDAYHRANARLVNHHLRGRTDEQAIADVRQALIDHGPEKALVTCTAIVVHQMREATP